MKKRTYILMVLLLGLAGTLSVSSAYAQRGHYGRGRVVVAPRVHAYRAPVFYGPRYYYRPYYRPYFRVIGPPIGVLPYGYVTLGTAWGPFFYFNGTFYRSYKEKEYEVVDPPVGIDVPTLPEGAEEVVIDGNTYYEKDGIIYQEVIKKNERRYAVVGKDGKLSIGVGDSDEPANSAPDGNIIPELPDGSRSVEINGQQYYLSPDGMYYQEVDGGYKVVGKQAAD